MTNGLFGGCFGHFNMYHHLNEKLFYKETIQKLGEDDFTVRHP